MGGFIDNFEISGSSSKTKNRAIDLRVYSGNIECGIQYYRLDVGYGMVYPFDKALSNGVWLNTEKSMHLRYEGSLTDKVNSTTLLRFRESNCNPESFFIEGYNSGVDLDGDGEADTTIRYVDASYWYSKNTSWSLLQDFTVNLKENLILVTGLKYEHKNLQRAYVIMRGPSITPDEVDGATYDYPEVPLLTEEPQNRIHWVDKGVYLQGKYTFAENHNIIIGARYDHNSAYGEVFSIRSGYVGHFNKFTAKVLYGEGQQEPSPRVLHGGWVGAGSDPDLKPEKAKTTEISIGHTAERFSNLLSCYYTKASDIVRHYTGGARNTGERDIWGFDYHFKALLSTPFTKQLSLWGYYSFINAEGDEIIVEEEEYIPEKDTTIITVHYEKSKVGDIANHKIHFGATAFFSDKLHTTLRGRFIGEKETIYTNPLKKIDGYFILDFNLTYKDFLIEGLGLSLNIYNLLDAEYFHTGTNAANSGDEPGAWIDGVWQGSKGWYSSKLPQPGRMILISLKMDI